MALRLNGSTSGYVEIDAPAVAGDNTLTLPSTPNGSLVALDSSGRLGIGTNSPSNLLHIAGTGTDLTGLRIVNTQHQAAATSTAGLKLGITNSAGQRNCRIQAREEAVDSNAIALDFFTNSADAVDGETVKMTVLHSGNVGIGTSVPTQLLELNGASNPCLLIKDTTNNVIAYTFADDSVANFGSASAHPVVFRINNNEAARIDSNGRLLVGTPTSLNGGGNQYSMVQVIGNYSNTPSPGYLALGRSEVVTSMSNNDPLGRITFTDNAAGDFARIEGVVDSNCGTNDYPGRLVFSTTADGASTPTERMRINKDGNANFYGTGGVIYSRSGTSAGTAERVFIGYHSASSVVTGSISINIYTNGNITNTNNSYGAISDLKLKENIVDATSQWSDIKALQVRKYNFKEETGQETHTQIGLVAQEAELVSPGLVSESPDRDEDGNDLGTVTKSVNYSVLYMKAVKALQEAIAKIESLEANTAALEARITALEVTP
jgi:hypothetical protein